MAYQITTEAVIQAMAPVLGRRFPEATGLAERAATVLRRHEPRREAPQMLCARLKDLIFGELYEQLGSMMLLRREDGLVYKIMLQDVDRVVDAVHGVLLEALTPPDMSLESLRAYAMQEGSLGAMKALLRRYGDSLPEMEKEMLRRILRENGMPHDEIP